MRVGSSGGYRPANGRANPDRLRNSIPRERVAAVATYVAAVIIAALLCLAATISAMPEHLRYEPGAFALIAALAVVVDVRPFVAAGRGASATIFPSIAFAFALLLGWGLAAAIIVQAASVVVSSVRMRHAPWPAAFNASQYGLSLAAAAVVLQLFDQPLMIGNTHIGLAGVLGIVLAGCAWFVVNDLLVATAIWLRFGGGWRHALTDGLTQEALSGLGLLALGPLVVSASDESAALIPLMLVPLYIVNAWGRFVESERRKSNADELTGLPNRRALLYELRSQIGGYAQRYGRRPGDPRRMALVMLDIVQFRRVNEALGHAFGDRLLVAVAARLRECVGADG